MEANQNVIDQQGGVPYRKLIWLAMATFSMGIDGYVLAGLLPQVSGSLKVTPAAAGQLMSVFALTSAIGGPVLSTLTSSWERKRTISLALIVFVLGNVAVAFAPSFGLAMGGRVVSALGACLLNAAVVAYALEITPVRHRGKTLSFVLGGWMTATALGVPVGLLVGRSNWRIPLLLVAVVGTIALVGLLLKLPQLHLPSTTLAARLRPLRNPRLVLRLVVTMGILCSSYTCFTYATLILGPHFKADWAIILIMFGYGLASMIGNSFSGRLADRFSALRVLTVILVGLMLNSVFGGTVLSLTGGLLGAILGLTWFFVAGIGNGGATVPQQSRLAALAPDSAAIAIALNGSAVSLGNALGSGLGGAALTAGLNPSHLPLISAVVLALTVGVHLVEKSWPFAGRAVQPAAA